MLTKFISEGRLTLIWCVFIHVHPISFPVFDTTIDEGKVILTFLVLVGFNVACALIAALLIVIEVS